MVRTIAALCVGAALFGASSAFSQEMLVGRWSARVQSHPRNPVVVTNGPDGPEYRFRVVPGMRWANDPVAERSEISIRHRLRFGSPVKQRFSVRASAGPVKEPRLIIGQWHPERSRGWGPWLAVVLTNKGMIELQTSVPDRGSRDRGTRRIVLHSEPFVPERWYDLELRFVAGKPPNSRLHAWLNGRPIAQYYGQLGYVGEADAGYWKFGAYRATPGNDEIEVSYRNVQLQIGNR